MSNLSHIQPPAATTSRADQLRPVVREWVGQSFFGPMLREARGSSLGPDDSPFGGGRGGEAFGQLFDQHMARHASSGLDGGIVEAVVRKLDGTK